jgi:hypothetical protein
MQALSCHEILALLPKRCHESFTHFLFNNRNMQITLSIVSYSTAIKLAVESTQEQRCTTEYEELLNNVVLVNRKGRVYGGMPVLHNIINTKQSRYVCFVSGLEDEVRTVAKVKEEVPVALLCSADGVPLTVGI